MNPKKPMLAVDAGSNIRFPILASPKLDGIRCTVWGGKPYTRSLKEIPNAHIRAVFAKADLQYQFDGELIVGDVNAKDVYNQTVKGVMAHSGEPKFSFWIFDMVLDCWDAEQRQKMLSQCTLPEFAGIIPQTMINNESELQAYEAEQLALGFEGVILRGLDGMYKHGRSTVKEGYLLKVKRFTDSEAVVVGMEELLRNQNEAFTNELGHTARSSAKDGKVPMDTMGALICRTLDGVEFNIGTGFTAEQRQRVWNAKADIIGKLAKYKHFEIGAKDKPRHPVFIGFRDERDLSS